MPILRDFTVPNSAKLLVLPDPQATFFIAFLSSLDPVTKQSWCPDVRVALPRIESAFSANTKKIAFIEVGQRPEWKDPQNFYRTNWNIHNVPTVVRYEFIDGELQETGRLVEDEILNEKTFADLVDGYGKQAGQV